jgi:hypothetical protein
MFARIAMMCAPYPKGRPLFEPSRKETKNATIGAAAVAQKPGYCQSRVENSPPPQYKCWVVYCCWSSERHPR